MGSKNNPAARGGQNGTKKVNGKVVKPVFYMGKYVGQSNYMAGQFEDGKMIMGANGNPMPFGDIVPDAGSNAETADDKKDAKKSAKK